jgi:endonuclease/exonuclease/phosphatase family metal-dependent hydrolase
LRIGLPRSENDARIKVLTLNIQRGKQGLGKVIDLIRRQDPEVICLQECDSTKEEPIVDQIRAGLPEYEITESRGVAVGSRLPVESFRVIGLPNGKPLVEARVMWRGKPVTVASVHLVAIFIDQYLFASPAKIPGHLRKAGAEREEQLQALLTHSTTVPNLILCGDFNAPANAGFHRRLGDRLTDSFATVGSGFGYTIPASFPLMRLDFVYTSHDVTPRRCEVLSEIVSDHRAVVAEMDFSSAGFQPVLARRAENANRRAKPWSAAHHVWGRSETAR